MYSTSAHGKTPILLIKSKIDKKLDKYSVRIKFCRDPMSTKLDPYEFKITLFGSDGLEEFLLFIRNFNTSLKASETLVVSARIQYLHTLVHG